MENRPSAITLLLSMNCKLLYNYMEMSAIDYAIYYKYPEAALAMVTHEERADEVMILKSDKHPCVTLALIASMPRVFEAVQDKCITKANCKKDSKSFYVSRSMLKIKIKNSNQLVTNKATKRLKLSGTLLTQLHSKLKDLASYAQRLVLYPASNRCARSTTPRTCVPLLTQTQTHTPMQIAKWTLQTDYMLDVKQIYASTKYSL